MNCSWCGETLSDDAVRCFKCKQMLDKRDSVLVDIVLDQRRCISMLLEHAVELKGSIGELTEDLARSENRIKDMVGDIEYYKKSYEAFTNSYPECVSKGSPFGPRKPLNPGL